MVSPDLDDEQTLLTFWFSDEAKKHWFFQSDAFDQKLKDQFMDLYKQAAAGVLDHWKSNPKSCLALIILLDQMPRNFFRGDGKSHATDAHAVKIAKYAIEQGYDLNMLDTEKMFIYLPFQHSENLTDQELSVKLTRDRIGEGMTLDYAIRHYDVIKKFGRFPHRNSILGRPSTEEEKAFLAETPAGF